MAYQELTCEKYWQASAKSEIAQLKAEQTGRSVRAFNMFLVAYLMFLGATYLLTQQPDWLPATLTYFEQTGIAERLRSIVVR